MIVKMFPRYLILAPLIRCYASIHPNKEPFQTHSLAESVMELAVVSESTDMIMAYFKNVGSEDEPNLDVILGTNKRYFCNFRFVAKHGGTQCYSMELSKSYSSTCFHSWITCNRIQTEQLEGHCKASSNVLVVALRKTINPHSSQVARNCDSSHDLRRRCSWESFIELIGQVAREMYLMHTEKLTTTAYQPQTKGMLERF